MEATINTFKNEAEQLKRSRMLLLSELDSHFDGDIVKLLSFIKEYYLDSREISNAEIKLIEDFKKGAEIIDFNREMDLLLLKQGKLKRIECPFCGKNYNEYENQESVCPYCNTKKT